MTKNRQNILVIIGSLRGGGAERVASTLANHWHQDLHLNSKVAVFDARGIAFNMGAPVIDLNIPAEANLFLKPFLLLRRVICLIRLFRKENPTKIISFMEPANFPTLIAAKLMSIEHKVTVSVRTHPGRLSHPRRLLMKLLYPSARHVVAVSKGVKDYLVRRMGILESKVLCIPNPVALSILSHDEVTHAPKWGSPALLAIGRLIPEKGFDNLIKAIAILRPAYPGIKLKILGEGPARNSLTELSAQLNVKDHVDLAGWSSHLREHFLSADLFVLSSRVEGWPNALVEALASGCLSVSTDCDFGPREITDNGTFAPLIDKNTPEQIADVCAAALQNESLKVFVKNEVPQKIREMCAMTSISSRWLES